MGFGEPKMPTPEEMAEINKQRRESDSKLIKGGAEVTADDKIIATEDQLKDAKIEMGDDFHKRYTELATEKENQLKWWQKMPEGFKYEMYEMDQSDFEKAEKLIAKLGEEKMDKVKEFIYSSFRTKEAAAWHSGRNRDGDKVVKSLGITHNEVTLLKQYFDINDSLINYVSHVKSKKTPRAEDWRK